MLRDWQSGWVEAERQLAAQVQESCKVHDEHAANHDAVGRQVVIVEVGPIGRIVREDEGRQDLIAADDRQHRQHRPIVERELAAYAVSADPKMGLVAK